MSIIHIYGASGSGTSTLARAIHQKYSYKMLDSDDYFWLPTNPPFSQTRPSEDRVKIMKKDMCNENKIVISGSLCGWGDELISLFNLVIRLNTPTDIRIERLRHREHKRFGDRIKPDGDMYKNHIEFLNWAKKYDVGDMNMRSKVFHDEWQKSVLCKHITLDGTKEIDLLLKEINDIYQL